MSPDKIQKIIDACPLLFAKLNHIECSDGWYTLLYSLSTNIEHMIKQLPEEMQGQIHAVQVKSKYGGLRFYMDHSTPRIDGAIDLAEDLSNNMCEDCGNYGGHKNLEGWIVTLCDKHYNKELKKRKK